MSAISDQTRSPSNTRLGSVLTFDISKPPFWLVINSCSLLALSSAALHDETSTRVQKLARRPRTSRTIASLSGLGPLVPVKRPRVGWLRLGRPAEHGLRDADASRALTDRWPLLQFRFGAFAVVVRPRSRWGQSIGGCVSRALSQPFTVGPTCAAHTQVVEPGEWQPLDGIDLDETAANGLPPSHLHLVARPESDGQSDLASDDALAQHRAELNGRRESPPLTERAGTDAEGFVCR